ncbi:hypothetical protein AVEN_169325-1 [Araneus ventricosus]|uniref:Uncharacterized protein n=1 Tax=Araneus ventricosus TaxID=182803 RepID=A0A4Y2P0I2_ARAVE|nr:hypothetical protein AVEN_169325-1 [Araneus ventricosus]
MDGIFTEKYDKKMDYIFSIIFGNTDDEEEGFQREELGLQHQEGLKSPKSEAQREKEVKQKIRGHPPLSSWTKHIGRGMVDARETQLLLKTASPDGPCNLNGKHQPGSATLERHVEKIVSLLSSFSVWSRPR